MCAYINICTCHHCMSAHYICPLFILNVRYRIIYEGQKKIIHVVRGKCILKTCSSEQNPFIYNKKGLYFIVSFLNRFRRVLNEQTLLFVCLMFCRLSGRTQRTSLLLSRLFLANKLHTSTVIFLIMIFML